MARTGPEDAVLQPTFRGLFGDNVCYVESVMGGHMSLVRLLGFTTLACGCVVGRYREVATSREVTYVEEKGASAIPTAHRRNHTVAAARRPVPVLAQRAVVAVRDRRLRVRSPGVATPLALLGPPIRSRHVPLLSRRLPGLALALAAV